MSTRVTEPVQQQHNQPPKTRYCGEITAGFGTVVSLGGTILSVVLKYYIVTPFSGLGTIGCGAWYWYSRKVRILKNLNQVDQELQRVDHDLEAVARRGEQAVDGQRRENLELAQRTDQLAHDRVEISEAERALNEELRRRQVDTGRLKETVIDLFKANDALTTEKEQIQKLLDSLLRQIAEYQRENELRRKSAAELGAVVVQVKAEEEKESQLLQREETELARKAHEVQQSVITLYSSGRELFDLLSAYIQKLSAERQAIATQADRRGLADSHAQERLLEVRRYEEEARKMSDELRAALEKIEELKREREELLQAVRKSEQSESQRASAVATEQRQWQQIVSGLESTGSHLNALNDRVLKALGEDDDQ
jgi:chromosome segregation ATPase